MITFSSVELSRSIADVWMVKNHAKIATRLTGLAGSVGLIFTELPVTIGVISEADFKITGHCFFTGSATIYEQ